MCLSFSSVDFASFSVTFLSWRFDNKEQTSLLLTKQQQKHFFQYSTIIICNINNDLFPLSRVPWDRDRLAGNNNGGGILRWFFLRTLSNNNKIVFFWRLWRMHATSYTFFRIFFVIVSFFASERFCPSTDSLVIYNRRSNNYWPKIGYPIFSTPIRSSDFSDRS